MCSVWLTKHLGEPYTKISEYYKTTPESKEWVVHCAKYFEKLRPQVSQNYNLQVKLAFWLSVLVLTSEKVDESKEDMMLRCWKKVMELSSEYEKTFADFQRYTQELKHWRQTLEKYHNYFIIFALNDFNLKEKDFIAIFQYFQPNWNSELFVTSLAESIAKGMIT
jgi:hypothetical protein